jgi:internalin A
VGITSLEPLKGLTNLSSLDLSGAIGITNLEPLKELTKLSSLDLSGATGITTLEPLRGRGIGIKGASDELLATKR